MKHKAAMSPKNTAAVIPAAAEAHTGATAAGTGDALPRMTCSRLAWAQITTPEAGELHQWVVNAHRTEDHSGDDVAHQYSRRSKLRQVYQQLSHRAECSADKESPHIFKQHIHFNLLLPMKFPRSAIPGILPPCCTIVGDISAPVAQ